jgi:hypothetical protein
MYAEYQSTSRLYLHTLGTATVQNYKVVLILPKIKFHDYAQKIRPRRSRKDTQEAFMHRLFYFAGVEGFEDDDVIAIDGYGDEYLRKIYAGIRPFTKGIKESILMPLPRESLISFFGVYIGAANLPGAMQRFDVPDVAPRNENLFYDALCTQFEHLIDVHGDEAEDIVCHEYVRQLHEHDTQELKSVNEYLHSDLDKLNEVIYKIKDLAKLLEDFDFIHGNSPIHDFLIGIKRISNAIPAVEFMHGNTAFIVNAFYAQRDSFVKYLYDVPFGRFYDGCVHDATSPLEMKDVISVANTIQGMKNSLYSSINDVFYAQNALKEEIMRLSPPTHIQRDYMDTMKKAVENAVRCREEYAARSE